ncbi:tripartite tricarboxylate transporter substrate binding protein [Bordetella sp. BOR01]|uniref:Bug family tripartite tricarboxylate transporter substrate binding protein n=1 Tax=Bordetella sp. BOR01 TaxID=2854779 RepID=UPI001C47F94C|nr:tripartite tricarboxylate transporter substrate binding protein [Bordetella sp. BOR01]MBV7482745.1 tripartite tricarboxylate transporter substrate binding protein [Bordetella sp. BOR01]
MLLKTLARFCLGIAAACSLAANAGAADWPQQPINLVVGSPPGGSTDYLARLLADPLGKELGQSVVVVNKPGGSGNLGNGYVANARPDGYTLVFGYNGYLVSNPHLFKDLDLDPVKRFTPVAFVASAPQLLVISSKAPFQDLPGLIQHAKANPGKLNYASSGQGSIPHVGAVMLEQMAGISMVHIPFKGAGDAMQAVAAGTVDFYITSPAGAMGQVKAGLAKPIAVSGDKRLDALPDVPTAAELGLDDYNVGSWFAIYGPEGLDPAIVARLNTAFNRVLDTEKIRKGVLSAGMYVDTMSPDELGSYTGEEFERWGAIIKQAGIKLD